MIKYMDLLKNMENFYKIDGIVMIKTERYNNNFNFYIETSKGWLFNVEKRESNVKCYAENEEKGNHFVINVNSVDSLLSTIDNYLNPPREIKLKKTDKMDILLKRLRTETTGYLEDLKNSDDRDEKIMEKIMETLGIIIDCLVDYVGNEEEIREIIDERICQAFE